MRYEVRKRAAMHAEKNCPVRVAEILEIKRGSTCVLCEITGKECDEMAQILCDELNQRAPQAAVLPERAPLTEDQIDEIHLKNSDAYERGDVEYESHGFARAIEAHHGIPAKPKEHSQ